MARKDQFSVKMVEMRVGGLIACHAVSKTAPKSLASVVRLLLLLPMPK